MTRAGGVHGPYQGVGSMPPVTRAERLAWLLAAAEEAIERMARHPHDPALSRAVVGRWREYVEARDAEGVRVQRFRR